MCLCQKVPPFKLYLLCLCVCHWQFFVYQANWPSKIKQRRLSFRKASMDLRIIHICQSQFWVQSLTWIWRSLFWSFSTTTFTSLSFRFIITHTLRAKEPYCRRSSQELIRHTFFWAFLPDNVPSGFHSCHVSSSRLIFKPSPQTCSCQGTQRQRKLLSEWTASKFKLQTLS